ncbi:hypothetical protein K435DRAFT_876774 [Dendrothele bispora CBS 962.96]|uniref:Uncharacterized protein n=1 Tax=Dendrothele bispora (strain CBS 962.96) TaxID=1314807 RepID=A0A4S8KRC1_DENBC|nr:hypothetical protein K435DRAFT_876774 [Dendrothele bispora CBS 962.96]
MTSLLDGPTVRQQTGEIDIEGVRDNEVTWHTGPGCFLTPESNFTGVVVSRSHPSYFFDNINKATVKTTPTATEQSPPNAGCGVQEWSRASYEEDFNLQSGGVFAMKWDENRIVVCEFLFLFYLPNLYIIFVYFVVVMLGFGQIGPSLPPPPPSSPLHI